MAAEQIGEITYTPLNTGQNFNEISNGFIGHFTEVPLGKIRFSSRGALYTRFLIDCYGIAVYADEMSALAHAFPSTRHLENSASVLDVEHAPFLIRRIFQMRGCRSKPNAKVSVYDKPSLEKIKRILDSNCIEMVGYSVLRKPRDMIFDVTTKDITVLELPYCDLI